MGLLLRPFRLISLLLLAALVGGGFLAWKRVHAARAASVQAARGEVVKAGPKLLGEARLPASGVYRYSTSGKESIGVGPVSLNRSLPSQSLLVVVPEAQGIQRQELRLSADHTLTVRTMTRKKDIAVVFRSERVGVLGLSTAFGGQVDTATWRPRRPAVGQAIDVYYRAGDGLVGHRQGKITQKTTVNVGGVEATAWVIEDTETFTGSVHGSVVEKVWWDPQRGLDLRREVHGSIDGTQSETFSYTLALQGLNPLTGAGAASGAGTTTG